MTLYRSQVYNNFAHDGGGVAATAVTAGLLSGSVAIDRGSNPLGRAYDQRGSGFPRVKGAAADIGATEH